VGGVGLWWGTKRLGGGNGGRFKYYSGLSPGFVGQQGYGRGCWVGRQWWRGVRVWMGGSGGIVER